MEPRQPGTALRAGGGEGGDVRMGGWGSGGGECNFSFNPDYMGSQVCDEAYPWCIDGDCFRLASGPWHNVGMPGGRLASFISWVPLVGGSIGAMLGGLVSDHVAQVRDNSTAMVSSLCGHPGNVLLRIDWAPP
ncbi:unnamed protein product [Discosporangium mesarthrocarpum]